MPLQVEYVDHALPYYSAAVSFRDGHGLRQRRLASVQPFNGSN
jgi:hypothetical protein